METGTAIAKLTRSRGFSLSPNVQHATTVGHLQALVEESLSEVKLWLQKLEYRDGRVYLLETRKPMRFSGFREGESDLKFWMTSQLPGYCHPGKPFAGMKKGQYWEVVAEGVRCFDGGLPVHSKPRPAFIGVKLMDQLAVLLYVYGPLTPEAAARGLSVKTQQAKGAAAALSRKELIVKGKEPYTPVDPTRAALKYWLHESYGDNLPRWMKSALKDPELLRRRAKKPT